MFTARINRYSSLTGDTTSMEFHLPARVTVTGKEDHFARAYEDVGCILAGLRELDRALGNESTLDANGEPTEVILRYDVVSITRY